jgi:hypothetical protein
MSRFTAVRTRRRDSTFPERGFHNASSQTREPAMKERL